MFFLTDLDLPEVSDPTAHWERHQALPSDRYHWEATHWICITVESFTKQSQSPGWQICRDLAKTAFDGSLYLTIHNLNSGKDDNTLFREQLTILIPQAVPSAAGMNFVSHLWPTLWHQRDLQISWKWNSSH